MKRSLLSYLFLVLVIGILSPEIKAQTERPLGSFPSPNAANLGLFTDVPVSKFTGTPNIEIPIYEIVEGTMKVPISLNYHPSSVRVHNHPGWVGEGWALQCGGAITRVMNGKIDEYTFKQNPSDPGSGFYNTYTKLSGTDTEWYSTQRLTQYRDDYVPGNTSRLEAMPDEFNFSFLGYSGKFFMGHDGQWKVVSDQDIKVEFNSAWGEGFIKMDGLRSNLLDRINYYGNSTVKNSWSDRYFNKFTLITPDGAKFEFGGVNATEYSVPFRTQALAYPTPVTWYLTKVTTPENRTIIFNYTPGDLIGNFSTAFYQSSTARNTNPPWGYGLDVDCGASVSLRETDFDGSMVFPVYLSSITFTNGSVVFQNSNSVELRWPSNAIIDTSIGGCSPSPFKILPVYFVDICSVSSPFTGFGDQFRWKKLDQIQIYDYKSVPNFIKRFDLTYTNSASTRLKLLEVKEVNPNGGSKSPYIFTYNPTSLPSYAESRKSDHWDFYNGCSTFPALTGAISTFNTNFYAAREADATGGFMKAEILEQVQYPTGGVVRFSFEPHTYSKVVDRENVAFPVLDLAQNKAAGGLRIRKISFFNKPTDTTPASVKEYFYVKNYSNGANVNSLLSSGVLGGYPKYLWSNYTAKDVGGTTFTYSVFSSGSVLPFGYNTSGNHIGYSEVIETSTNTEGIANGYLKSIFTNFDQDFWGDQHLDQVGVSNDPSRSVYSPYSSNELQRGKLLGEEFYTATSTQPIRTIKYKYTIQNNGYVRRVLQEPFDVCSQTTASAQICFVTAFKTYSYRYNLSRKETTEFDGTNSFLTVTNFGYNAQNLISSVNETNSDGSTSETITKYPLDYTTMNNITQQDWEAIGISDLIRKNIINAPIETIKKRDNNVIASTLIGYKTVGSNVLPFKVWSLETTSALPIGVTVGKTTGLDLDKFNPAGIYLDNGSYFFGKDEHYTQSPTIYNKYDETTGNLLEYFNSENTVTSFLYSYGNSLPVAKIVGASYAQVTAALGSLSIDIASFNNGFLAVDNLLPKLTSLQNALPNAQVACYAYNAFGLMVSKDLNGLNTYYQYDELGRLQFVKNYSADILKAYKYHYSGE